MIGALAEGVLPPVLQAIYVGRESGILHVSREDARRSLYFRRGVLVHAGTNVREERLGEVLVHQGFLKPEDLKRATEVLVRENKRLGKALVDLELLTKDRVEHALTEHARLVLEKILSAHEGSYEFEPKPEDSFDKDDFPLKLTTGEIVLDAVRRVEDPDVVRYALGDIDRILGLSSDPELRFQNIILTPTDGYVLSRVDGSLSAREVIQATPLEVEETQRSLFGLLCTGVVEFLPLPPKPKPSVRLPRAHTAAPPAPAATPDVPAEPTPEERAHSAEMEARRLEIAETFDGLKGKNHFEVLGIPRGSTEAQVKEAYFRQARRYHPDARQDPALADLRDKMDAIFIRLGHAFEVLRNTRARLSYEATLPARSSGSMPAAREVALPAPPPDPALEARRAAENVRRAEKLMEESKYWDAIQLLEPAVQALGGAQKQRARVVLARALVKNPNWLHQAEEVLQTVVQDEPSHQEAHFALGALYRERGLKSRAAGAFRRVLDLNPEHKEAAAELLEMGDVAAEAPAESGGLLRKLFGRRKEGGAP
jgi:tetratricopeptide (TPR) repeat protein